MARPETWILRRILIRLLARDMRRKLICMLDSHNQAYRSALTLVAIFMNERLFSLRSQPRGSINSHDCVILSR